MSTTPKPTTAPADAAQPAPGTPQPPPPAAIRGRMSEVDRDAHRRSRFRDTHFLHMLETRPELFGMTPENTALTIERVKRMLRVRGDEKVGEEESGLVGYMAAAA